LGYGQSGWALWTEWIDSGGLLLLLLLARLQSIDLNRSTSTTRTRSIDQPDPIDPPDPITHTQKHIFVTHPSAASCWPAAPATTISAQQSATADDRRIILKPNVTYWRPMVSIEVCGALHDDWAATRSTGRRPVNTKKIEYSVVRIRALQLAAARSDRSGLWASQAWVALALGKAK
jgi:hypothetical protein